METSSLLIDAALMSQTRCNMPISVELAYTGNNNFMGRPVAGYHLTQACFVTPKVAVALCDVHNELNQQGLGLFIFDAYRPLRAVRDFAAWFEETETSSIEITRKAIHYPHLDKSELAPRGYIADKVSRHCFGYAVDLSLQDLSSGELLDMGACFDYFDEIAHITTGPEQIGEAAYNNRQRLQAVMEKHGFIPYEFEYWHFDYHIHELAEPLDVPINHELYGKN